jgi:hypothetical protein
MQFLSNAHSLLCIFSSTCYEQHTETNVDLQQHMLLATHRAFSASHVASSALQLLEIIMQATLISIVQPALWCSQVRDHYNIADKHLMQYTMQATQRPM